MLDMLMLVLYN